MEDSECIKSVTERPVYSLPTIEELMAAQKEQFGEFDSLIGQKESSYILSDEGLLAVLQKNKLRVVVPTSLQGRILDWAHGSREVGHYGVRRTILRILNRFWWPTIRANVSKKVDECMSCDLLKAPRPKKQGKIKKYHPRRRWEIVAVDVLSVSPESTEGNKKILVIGDCFTRYMCAAPMKNEQATTIASTLLSEWILRYGPPENLLSDRGKPFLSRIIEGMCQTLGVHKITCSPYHPQTDGMVERFNRTLCNDLASYVSVSEDDWDKHIAMACFRYNTTVHEATGMTPFKAMFGVDAFELDNEIGLQSRIDEDQGIGEELAKNLALLYQDLVGKGHKARDRAEKYYNKAIKEVVYDEGGRVLVYNPQADLEKGRKLSAPWIGPYGIEKKLSNISYILKSEVGGKTARVHVNSLRHFSDDHKETGEPVGGVFPDSRRIIQSIRATESREDGRYFKVISPGRTGVKWVQESDLPELVVKAYDILTWQRERGDGRD